MADLENAVNKIIRDLYRKDGCVSNRKLAEAKRKYGCDLRNEAINWGDLGVVEIVQRGATLIYIEEVDPGACHLHNYILIKLKELGFETEKIAIITEW